MHAVMRRLQLQNVHYILCREVLVGCGLVQAASKKSSKHMYKSAAECMALTILGIMLLT